MLINSIIILLIIPYIYCIEFKFINVPNKFIPGQSLNIQFNLLNNVNQTEYKIDFFLCQLNYCDKIGNLSTSSEINSYNITTLISDNICYFSNKPTTDWEIRADVIIDEQDGRYEDAIKLNRELICSNAQCIEEKCKKELIKDDTNASTSLINENREASPEKKKNNPHILLYILLTFLTLLVLFGSIGTIIYVNNYKKKDDDPIPIFSVEDSSYCCEVSSYSPPMANASYHSNIMDKSLLSIDRSIKKGQPNSSGFCQSPKNIDQSHLSVHLQPIPPVNDYYSHSSQNSNKSRNLDNSTFDNQSNDIKSISSKHSNPGSPNIYSFSPMSASSTIPFVTSHKASNNKKSIRSENKKAIPNSPHIYSESSVVIDKKGNNSYLFSESPMLSDARSKISDKHSYHSNQTNVEEETKVLSSKHYVLSNFEGDYNKEELNLHYGDIVSVINILPEGWAYGELLLKYNAYDTSNNKNIPKINSKEKYRKFGYYPIKCLSPDEDSDDLNTPPLKKGNTDPLASTEAKRNATMEKPNPKENKEMFEKEKDILPIINDNQGNNANSLPPKSATNTIHTKSSKRSSLLNFFKRTSKDFSLSTQEAVLCYSEPNSSSDKLNSREGGMSDTESTSGTIYHDAEEEEYKPTLNSKFDSKRISMRSSLSYRSYM